MMKRFKYALAVTLIGALLASFVLPPTTTRAADEDGWVSLFDGKTLKNWDGEEKFWSVQDGAITGITTPENPTRGNTFIVWTGGELADFELKLEYRIMSGNSGVQYRSFRIDDNNKYRIGGYQADMEAGDRYSGICYGEAFRGILADRGQKTVIEEGGKPKVVGSVGNSADIAKAVKKQDWNEYHITAKGFHFVQKINGVTTCEFTDEDTDVRKAKGLLALQLHAGPPMKVQFRNIRVKHLTPVATRDAAAPGHGDKKKVVFVAGNKSHGFGSHEHRAGSMLLADALNKSGLPIEAVVVTDGWPSDESVFDGAAAVVIYADGGGSHPAIRRPTNARTLDELVEKGIGVGCIHYAVEVPKGSAGQRMLNWIGGYFETNWSVNPHWTIQNASLAEGHLITRGVDPFQLNDEWYYHMRFREGLSGVTPILTALPPADTLKRGDGPHSGNPAVRKAVLEDKQPQHVMWSFDRAAAGGKGRGFGFTGGHFHWNWAQDANRTLVLNAIAWIAGVEVPSTGVPSKTPTFEQMLANQDYDAPGDLSGVKRRYQEIVGGAE